MTSHWYVVDKLQDPQLLKHTEKLATNISYWEFGNSLIVGIDNFSNSLIVGIDSFGKNGSVQS